LNDGASPSTADELDSAVEPRTDGRNDFSHKQKWARRVLDTSNLL
jgi:hypothetical protein